MSSVSEAVCLFEHAVTTIDPISLLVYASLVELPASIMAPLPSRVYIRNASTGFALSAFLMPVFI
jgi:hypothetical protein